MSPEHIPDKPRHLIEFNRNADDGNSSVSEEDLQETHKKLTETIRTNNESKYVDEFVNLFMTNDQPNEPQTKQEKFEIKRAEAPRRGLKVKVSGGNVD